MLSLLEPVRARAGTAFRTHREKNPPRCGPVAFACPSPLEWMRTLLGFGPLDVHFCSARRDNVESRNGHKALEESRVKEEGEMRCVS